MNAIKGKVEQGKHHAVGIQVLNLLCGQTLLASNLIVFGYDMWESTVERRTRSQEFRYRAGIRCNPGDMNVRMARGEVQKLFQEVAEANPKNFKVPG